jgi:hypothetical protein
MRVCLFAVYLAFCIFCLPHTTSLLFFLIATYACLEEGLLLVTPDPTLTNGESDDQSHLVTVDDIMASTLRASVVVLSAGYTPLRKKCVSDGYRLATAFLSAGKLYGFCVFVSRLAIVNNSIAFDTEHRIRSSH